MSTETTESPADVISRAVGGTEYSWCRAVPGGTGVTVLSLLFTKEPDVKRLQEAIHSLQNAHPILRSKLRWDPQSNIFSFVSLNDKNPCLQIQSYDQTHNFYLTVEHEMNTNIWQYNNTNNNGNSVKDIIEHDVMFASVHKLPEGEYAVVLRLHTAVCDRAAATFLLRELLGLFGGDGKEIVKEEGLGLSIEECVPPGKASKPFWARGADMLGYSVNSFRFSNLEFKESGFPKGTEFVRMRIGEDDTARILEKGQKICVLSAPKGIPFFYITRTFEGCKLKEIKLFGLLAAAGFIAAHASKNLPAEKWEKYSLATLIDCRSVLDPALSDHHVGFYHSAILNSHDVKGGEDLWDLAHRIYTTLANAKNNKKHFTDMADLNFLMGKAIDNPGLTPSSSLRTSLISVFEETITQNRDQFHKDIGLVDCIGCASVHGVSPSLAIFDTVRDGELDCACVYPSPTHSREQMQDFVDHMKKILTETSVPH